MLARIGQAVAVFVQPVQAARPAFAVEINHKEPGFLASRDAYQRRTRPGKLLADYCRIAARIFEPARGDRTFLPIAGKDRPARGKRNGAIHDADHWANLSSCRPMTKAHQTANATPSGRIRAFIRQPPGTGEGWPRPPSCGHPSEIGAAPLPCLGGVVCCGSSRKRSLPVTV